MNNSSHHQPSSQYPEPHAFLQGTSGSPAQPDQLGGNQDGQPFVQPNAGMQNNGQTFTQPNNGMPAQDQHYPQANSGMPAEGQPYTQPNAGMPNNGQTFTQPNNGMPAQDQHYPQTNSGMPAEGQPFTQPNPGMMHGSGIPQNQWGTTPPYEQPAPVFEQPPIPDQVFDTPQQQVATSLSGVKVFFIAVVAALIVAVPTAFGAAYFMGSSQPAKQVGITEETRDRDLSEMPADGELSAGNPLTAVQRVAEYSLPSVAAIVTSEGAGGSGVAYREGGYIITNYHVIHGATRVFISIPGGQQYEAKVVGTARKFDLAVLKVDADIKPLKFADELPPVGSQVVAIGAPHGFESTVTSGIISAHDRNLGPDVSGMLQTDTAISPGNSGGPLLNLNGEVVGINTLQFNAGAHGNIGINLSIPSVITSRIADQIIEKGFYQIAQLGIRGTNVNRAVAIQLDLDQNHGVLIMEVTKDSAAEKLGLKEGDIITQFGDKKIITFSDLNATIRARSPGDKVEVTWIEADSKKSVTKEVTLGGVKASE